MVVEISPEPSSWRSDIEAAQRILNDAASKRQSYMDGLTLMSSALALEPDSLISYTLYSDLYLKTGRLRDAVMILERALERDVPGSESAWFRIAYLYDMGGSPDAAIASYEQALVTRPDDTNLINGYINALIRAKRYDEALYHLSLGNHVQTKALVLFKMAESLIEHPDEQRWIDLVSEAERLLVDADENTLIHAAMMTSNLALLYAGEDESVPRSMYLKAVTMLEPLTRVTENPDTVWSLLLDLYTVLGNESDAEIARGMLSLDPTN
jgi:tetratricopeptide (TPR) repeat protein